MSAMDSIPAVSRQVEPSSVSHQVDPSETSPEAAASRELFRAGGLLPTSLCLAKAAVGAGVLSMSLHASEVGCLYMLVWLILGGCLTIVSVRMIADASIATGRWSFEDISEELFHPAMAFFTGFVNVCNCLGAAAGYLIVCGQVFVVLTDCTEQWRKIFVTFVGVFVCGPLSLAPHVAFMRHLAAVSVGAIFLLVAVVGSRVVEDGVHDDVSQQNFWFGKGGADAFAYMNCINGMVFAYNNQFNVPQLTGELTPEPDVRRMTMVGFVSTGLTFFLYAAVSVAGVLAFGVYDQKDTLILDLKPYRSDNLVIVANIAVMFSVITCFQFHIYPIRQFCVFAARKARGRKADDSTDTKVLGITITRWLDMACAVASVLIAVLIAVAIDELTKILDLIGAFASSWISYVVPPLFVLQIRRGAKGFSWLALESLACLCVCALGVFFFLFGTYSAVLNIID